MIFEPTTIAKMELSNRFVRSATYDGMANRDGKVSQEQVALYTALARGGVGLIVTGLTSVHTSGRISGFQNTIHDDGCKYGLERLVDSVHRHGARVALQLAHAGREAYKYQAYRHSQAIAPSVITEDPYCEASYRSMTEDEIAAIVRAFGDGARSARDAGFDAVQIHAAHAYLISQFLSPFTNRRTDRWGGSFENRSRFLHEIYLDVRAKVGPDFPVMIKIGVEDGFAGGLEFKDGCRMAVLCAQWGFDALEISQGLRGKKYAQTEFRTAINRPGRDAYFRNWCREVKSRVHVPVMMVGGLRNPALMDAVIRRGEADFVSLCRPLIREPDLIRRWQQDRKHEPACISCNLCFEALLDGRPLGCAVEAKNGH
jgi:2,4-dienoyl-CoA reductase-like NADH-dependent reductase (Old Yellow Enzyme family)